MTRLLIYYSGAGMFVKIAKLLLNELTCLVGIPEKEQAPYIKIRRVPYLFQPYSFTSTITLDLNSIVNLSS
jgi:hypothetical protein